MQAKQRLTHLCNMIIPFQDELFIASLRTTNFDINYSTIDLVALQNRDLVVVKLKRSSHLWAHK